MNHSISFQKPYIIFLFFSTYLVRASLCGHMQGSQALQVPYEPRIWSWFSSLLVRQQPHAKFLFCGHLTLLWTPERADLFQKLFPSFVKNFGKLEHFCYSKIQKVTLQPVQQWKRKCQIIIWKSLSDRWGACVASLFREHLPSDTCLHYLINDYFHMEMHI